MSKRYDVMQLTERQEALLERVLEVTLANAASSRVHTRITLVRQGYSADKGDVLATIKALKNKMDIGGRGPPFIFLVLDQPLYALVTCCGRRSTSRCIDGRLSCCDQHLTRWAFAPQPSFVTLATGSRSSCSRPSSMLLDVVSYPNDGRGQGAIERRPCSDCPP